MSDSFPVNGERYLQQIIERMTASDDGVDYAQIVINILEEAQLEDDFYTYQMRTQVKDHHCLDRLIRGENVYTRVLAEAANLAEMDVYLIHERNQTVCNLSSLGVGEAIDLILKNAGVKYRQIPKGANREVIQLRKLHNLDSVSNCRMKIYTVLKLLFWLDIKIVLQYNAERAAREIKRVQNMTKYAGPQNI